MKKMRNVLSTANNRRGVPVGVPVDSRAHSLETNSSINTVETDVSGTAGDCSSVDFADCPFLGHRLYKPTIELYKQALGCVYLAKNVETGATVVIKLIERGASVTRHVERELLIHRRCSGHPFITQLIEVFLTPRHLAIVLEYVPGGDVLELVNLRRGLAAGDARWLFQQMVVGMLYMHSLGVNNREIKLDNKLLAYPEGQPSSATAAAADAVDPSAAAAPVPNGVIAMDADASTALPGTRSGQAWGVGGRPVLKIQDFMYSKSEQINSDPHSALGSLPYTAPEVLSNSMTEGAAADVWALGVALFKMTTGLYPFERPEDQLGPRGAVQAVLTRIARVDYAIPDNMSAPLRDLLSRMLVKEAAERIHMADIPAHPWFQEDIQPDLLELNAHVDPERVAKQSEAEVRALVEEAMASLRHVDSQCVDEMADEILNEEEADDLLREFSI